MKKVITSLLIVGFMTMANAAGSSRQLKRLVTKARTMVNNNETDVKKMSSLFSELTSQLSDTSLQGVEREIVLKATARLMYHCEDQNDGKICL